MDIDQATLARYKANYSIPASADVTAAMVQHHWDMERSLTTRLMASTPETRWATFDDCYSALYRECPWLNSLPQPTAADDDFAFRHYLKIIGPTPLDIYEVGSGEGRLIRYLAAHGHRCVATEVTRERSAERAKVDRVEWHKSDGVHLANFEPAGRYDVVLSTQVVEHLHPDDLSEHFRGTRAILKPGGRYIFTTPHAYFGPADLSRVFLLAKPEGMHLKEYRYGELVEALHAAGFERLAAVFVAPNVVRRRLPLVFQSALYLRYLMAMERTLAPALPRLMKRLALFTGDAFLIASK